MDNTLHLCMCGKVPTISRHSDRDWICLSCDNPNCLTPSTGWGQEAQMIDKWNKLIPSRSDIDELLSLIAMLNDIVEKTCLECNDGACGDCSRYVTTNTAKELMKKLNIK